MGIFLYSNDEELELAKMPPAARGSFEKLPLDREASQNFLLLSILMIG